MTSDSNLEYKAAQFCYEQGDREGTATIGELEAIVRDLADHQGPVGWDAYGRPPLCLGRIPMCLLCASPEPGLASLDAHQPFCPWRRAREWVAAHNVTVTETGMTHDTRH